MRSDAGHDIGEWRNHDANDEVQKKSGVSCHNNGI